MFEQSLVESSGNLRSKASRWMAFAAAFNLSVLALLMVKPLLYPEALPPTVLAAMLTAPPPPAAAAPTPRHAEVSKAAPAKVALDPFTVPARIPAKVDTSHEDPPPSTSVTGAMAMDSMGGGGLGPSGALGLAAAPVPVVVKVAPAASKAAALHVSGGVIAGSKLAGSTPIYPPIAKAAHVAGAVILHAVISKTGTIRSLSVVSGPEMLRGSAVAAVQDWRYQPYLLNGEPTEVDTTITVNFSFGG